MEHTWSELIILRSDDTRCTNKMERLTEYLAASATMRFDDRSETIEIGFVRKGIGRLTNNQLRLDCYGTQHSPLVVMLMFCESLAGDIAGGLPSGGSSAMSMFLPLGSGQIAGNFGVRFSNSANYSSIELSMGRVGRHTVVGGLKKQVQAGDPVIVLEVLKDTGDINPQCICTLPTRASLLLAAMESDAKSILLSKSDKDLAQAATFRRRDTTVAYSLARLSLCTLLAIGAVWMLYLDSGQILELTPRFPFFGGNGAPTIDEVLAVPQTLTHILDPDPHH